MCREETIAYIVETIRTLLRDTAGPIEPSTSLPDLRGFDSLLVASLLERIEDHFGIEMNPEWIVPETFETPAAIADALQKSNTARNGRLP